MEIKPITSTTQANIGSLPIVETLLSITPPDIDKNSILPINLFVPHGKEALVVTRGGEVNMQSFASAVVCNKDGEIIKQFTPKDAEERVNVHSAVKPFHTGLLIELMNELRTRNIEVPDLIPQELAVLSASHSGSNEHRSWVRTALDKAHLDEGYMTCGKRYPFDEEARDSLIRSYITPPNTPPLYDQCSGHHTCQGILAKLMNVPTQDYYKPEGKVQGWLLKKLIEHSSDKNAKIIPFDNCNIPTFNISLPAFATLYAKFISNPNFKPVLDAMAQHPELVSDNTSLDSCLIKLTNGNLLAKHGAEGLTIVANKALKNTLVLKEWGGNGTFRDRLAIKALKEIDWITNDQATTLFNMPEYAQYFPKHGIKYEFNVPLWK